MSQGLKEIFGRCDNFNDIFERCILRNIPETRSARTITGVWDDGISMATDLNITIAEGAQIYANCTTMLKVALIDLQLPSSSSSSSRPNASKNNKHKRTRNKYDRPLDVEPDTPAIAKLRTILRNFITQANLASSVYNTSLQQPEDEQQDYINFWLDSLNIKTEDTAKAGLLRISTLNSFIHWSKAQGKLKVFQPTPVQMAKFLHYKRAGGPAASRTASMNLAWFEKALGLNFHTANQICKAQSVSARGHTPRQAKPYGIQELIHVESIITSTTFNNEFLRNIALTTWATTMGTLRYAHYQRSSLHRQTPNVMMFKCHKGKTVHEQMGFVFIIPNMGINGEDIGTHISKHFSLINDFSEATIPYGCYDWKPISSDFFKATHKIDEPMSLKKYIAAMQQMLTLHPLCFTRKQSKERTSYSSRRWMPTIAGHLKVKTEGKAALGNWQDHVDEDKSSNVRKYSKSMAIHYDHHKIQQTAICKGALVGTVRAAATELDSYDIPWSTFNKMGRSYKKLSETHKHFSEDLDSSEDECDRINRLSFPIKPPGPPTPHPPTPEELPLHHTWTIPRTTNGKIHAFLENIADTSKVLALCQRNIYTTQITSNINETTSLSFQWCKNCFALQNETTKRFINNNA